MKFCLIDVANLIHRARRVQGKSTDTELMISMSLQTIFLSMSKVFNKLNAEHAVMCFDTYSWRKVIFEDYKAHRTEKVTRSEQRIRESINRICDDLELFLRNSTNATVLRHELIEADDFIARWIALHPNDDHIIISSDSDFKQLIAPNVEIYNGISGVLTTIDGVFFQDGGQDAKYPKVHMYNEIWKQKLIVEKQKVTDVPVAVEPKWELFLKIMKGDVSDNIPAAHVPRLRTTKLREAFENPNGEMWNEIMEPVRYHKTIEEDGVKLVKDVTVRDLYNRNTLLVDLTAQPVEIIELIDTVIEEAIAVPRKKSVGVSFLSFCGQHNLVRMANNVSSYVKVFSKGYAT